MRHLLLHLKVLLNTFYAADTQAVFAYYTAILSLVSILLFDGEHLSTFASRND